MILIGIKYTESDMHVLRFPHRYSTYRFNSNSEVVSISYCPNCINSRLQACLVSRNEPSGAWIRLVRKTMSMHHVFCTVTYIFDKKTTKTKYMCPWWQQSPKHHYNRKGQGHKIIYLGVILKSTISGVYMPSIKSLSLKVQKLYRKSKRNRSDSVLWQNPFTSR